MEETATKWLFDQLWEQPKDKFTWYAILKQAEEKFEAQLEKTWDDAYDKGTRDRLEKVVNPVGDAKTYFKETFKQ